MKLKGLVWFFTIALIIISVWELSYTWAVRNYESTVKEQAEKIVKKQAANLSPEERESLVKAKIERILDSTRDKDIYLGTTYQKCKENELNLGLDLQGGMSVTMDVSLEGMIKSLSNNPKDQQLQNALRTATAKKSSSDADYITLFSDAYIQQNGAGKLSSVFAGPGKDVKIDDKDDAVITKIRTIAKGAINQTYKILVKRIDKFGVAQPNINLDVNKGVINVELAGVNNPERVRKFLQSSANLQFWEVYQIDELASSLKNADDNLKNY
jgi:SecD/SecF fusion protein